MADDDTTNDLPSDQDIDDTVKDPDSEVMSLMRPELAMMLWLMRVL